MAQGTKTIVTHLNPHLDEIVCVWLLHKFHPQYRKFRMKFISANIKVKDTEEKNHIYVGVGRGRFDEHKGQIKECATTLVYKFLKNKGYIPKDKLLKGAVEKLVQYVYLDDTGQLQKIPFYEFHFGNIFEPLRKGKNNSLKVIKLGVKLVDLMVEMLKEIACIEGVWGKRKEFKSRFGKSVGVKLSHGTDSLFVQSYAYQRGFDVLVLVNLANNFKRIVAPADSRVNLKPIYDKLKKLEPEVNWFFHHSHKMVICGSSVAPEVKKSKLSLEELIRVVKSV